MTTLVEVSTKIDIIDEFEVIDEIDEVNKIDNCLLKLDFLTIGNMIFLTASLKSLFLSDMLFWPAAKCEQTKHNEVEWYLKWKDKNRRNGYN